MEPRTWHRREVDWDGPIVVEVDRSHGEGRPFAARIPAHHGARLHLRINRPTDGTPSDADLERVTDLVERTVGDLGGLLVARTHRPDRSSFVTYLPTRSGAVARDRVSALTDADLAPFTPMDVILDRDEEWDFYLSELLPQTEDWSLDFPTRAAAEKAGRRLEAIGLEVGEPMDVDGTYSLSAFADSGIASWEDVEALVVGCGGQISGHGSTM